MKKKEETIIREIDFNKTLEQITAEDRYLYENMPTLPDGIILIDMNDSSKTKSGHITFTEESKKTFIRHLKEICNNQKNMV